MKQLQNDFTTPDQSKRLLELGVPAWTADCYYYEEGGISKDCTPNIVPFGEVWTDDSTETMFSSYVDIPCWSVGRLIEIWNICVNACACVTAKRNETRVELFVKLYEENAIRADFSKLED